MVDISSFGGALNFVHTSGYFIIFIFMILGGSTITTIVAFAASIGYLNFFIVLPLAFIAELTEATIFYALGYFGRHKLIGEYGSFLGIKVRSLYKLETHFQNNFSKTLFFIKMTPFLSIPGLTFAGVSHVRIKKYAFWNIVIAFFKTVVFSFIGVILGFVALSFLKNKPLGITLFILVLILLGLSWAAKRFLQKVLKKELSLDKIEFFGGKLWRKKSYFFLGIKEKLRFVNKFFN